MLLGWIFRCLDMHVQVGFVVTVSSQSSPWVSHSETAAYLGLLSQMLHWITFPCWISRVVGTSLMFNICSTCSVLLNTMRYMELVGFFPPFQKYWCFTNTWTTSLVNTLAIKQSRCASWRVLALANLQPSQVLLCFDGNRCWDSAALTSALWNRSFGCCVVSVRSVQGTKIFYCLWWVVVAAWGGVGRRGALCVVVFHP